MNTNLIVLAVSVALSFNTNEVFETKEIRNSKWGHWLARSRHYVEIITNTTTCTTIGYLSDCDFPIGVPGNGNCKTNVVATHCETK